MPAETVATFGVLKWLTGLILVPWMWYERRRVDALIKELREYKSNNYSKEEVKEQIELRNKPIIDKLDMIYSELTKMRKS